MGYNNMHMPQRKLLHATKKIMEDYHSHISYSLFSHIFLILAQDFKSMLTARIFPMGLA
jgi:hypothetical protein